MNTTARLDQWLMTLSDAGGLDALRYTDVKELPFEVAQNVFNAVRQGASNSPYTIAMLLRDCDSVERVKKMLTDHKLLVVEREWANQDKSKGLVKDLSPEIINKLNDAAAGFEIRGLADCLGFDRSACDRQTGVDSVLRQWVVVDPQASVSRLCFEALHLKMDHLCEIVDDRNNTPCLDRWHWTLNFGGLESKSEVDLRNLPLVLLQPLFHLIKEEWAIWQVSTLAERASTVNELFIRIFDGWGNLSTLIESAQFNGSLKKISALLTETHSLQAQRNAAIMDGSKGVVKDLSVEFLQQLSEKIEQDTADLQLIKGWHLLGDSLGYRREALHRLRSAAELIQTWGNEHPQATVARLGFELNALKMRNALAWLNAHNNAAPAPPAPPPVVDEDKNNCIVCTVNTGNFALNPCGHLGFCNSCIKPGMNCAICRVKVVSLLKTFKVN